MSSHGSAPRIAVIGCGAAAREFCLPVLRRFSGYRKRVVLVDISPEQAASTAREFHIEHWCTDYRSLPLEVDAAMITTPHHLHAEQACHFLSQGLPVLVEKPLGMTETEALSMTELASAQSAVLMVNNYRRLFPAYQRVQRILSTGELGSCRRVDIWDGTRFAWASVSGFYLRDPRARGVLLDRGAHTVDVLCWWLGGCPAIVSSRTDAMGGVEAVAKLELAYQQTVIHLAFSRLERLRNRYELQCERGTIRGRLFDFSRLEIERNGKRDRIQAGPMRGYADWAWKLVSNFVQVVRGDERPLFEARDVAPSIGLLEQAYQQAGSFAMPWYDADPNVAALTRGDSAVSGDNPGDRE